MNIVKVFKDGECGVMRCQSPMAVLADGAAFGRASPVPLCEKHASITAAPQPPPVAALAVGSAIVPLPPQDLQTEAQSEISAAKEALEAIQQFEIATDADLTFAGECLGEAKGHYNRLEERKKQATGPLNEALRAIRSWFAPAQDFYATSEKILKDKIKAYNKLREDERQRALDAAAAAHRAGNPEATQAAIAAVPEAPPKLNGVSLQEEWTYEVTNFALVPDKFKAINHPLVMAIVKESKGAMDIPGLAPVRGTRVVARGT